MERDTQLGLQLAEEGKQKAIDNAYDRWRKAFKRAIVTLADTCEPFTSEDAVEQAGLPSGQVGTNINNAVGAIMSAAARKKVIRPTGRRVRSTRPTSHGAELKEWIGTNCP